MELIPAKTILARPKNALWFGNDYHMNLYRGCCHGCIYCDSRSDCYHIENFDRVRLKENAAGLLEAELRKKRKKGVVGIGAMSDTYNPFERKEQATRHALALLERYGFGVSLDTKSDLVTRDIDILQKIAKKAPVIIKFTITTTDDSLAKVIEPNVCVSSGRFLALRELSRAGIFAGVFFTPMLPFITDNEENVRSMVKLAQENGAKFIYSIFGVTLRENQRDYYYEKLDRHFPGLKQRYAQLYGSRYVCKPLRAKELYRIFVKECNERGLFYQMEDIIGAYKKQGSSMEQLKLF